MTNPNSEKPPGGQAGGAADEAVMGRAFQWSVMTLLLVMMSIGLLYLINRDLGTGPKAGSGLAATEASQSMAGQAPGVGFSDMTEAGGIRFRHYNGAQGEKLLPETMGGGCAFADVDGDGDADLLFVNGCDWPWAAAGREQPDAVSFYRNDGTGRFQDATEGSGLEVSFYGMGVAAGDYDDDGRVDLFVTGVGDRRLFRNLGGGKFEDESGRAGVGAGPEDWSTSAAWADYDRDGDLDLFVCQYVRWSRQIDAEVDYKLAGIGRAYGPPMNFPGSFPVLYRNEGGGRFVDVSEAAGVCVRNRATGLPLAKSLGVAPADVNGDGWIDFIVANDTVQNFLFTNRHDGTFREVGAASGIAFDNFGGARGAMGIDVARILGDRSLAISIGNFANEMTALYVSAHDELTFTDQAMARGIGRSSQQSLTFGVFFFDYDLDGWQDLLTANGHIEEQIGRVHSGQGYRQSAQLFWNARGHGFVTVPSEKCGGAIQTPIVGRGSAYADIDGDGDLDVVLTQISGRPLLLRNDGGRSMRWVRLKLVGSQSNRDAIGAWVEMKVGSRVEWRQVMPARGYLSQSELPVTFGLGESEVAGDVIVHWPSGIRQSLQSPPLNRLTEVREPER